MDVNGHTQESGEANSVRLELRGRPCHLLYAPIVKRVFPPRPSEKGTACKIYIVLPENGSSQGQNLALTVLSVPTSLDDGMTCGGWQESGEANSLRLELRGQPYHLLQAEIPPLLLSGLSLSLSVAHTHTLSLSLSLSQTYTHTHTLSLFLSHTHSLLVLRGQPYHFLQAAVPPLLLPGLYLSGDIVWG